MCDLFLLWFFLRVFFIVLAGASPVFDLQFKDKPSDYNTVLIFICSACVVRVGSWWPVLSCFDNYNLSHHFGLLRIVFKRDVLGWPGTAQNCSRQENKRHHRVLLSSSFTPNIYYREIWHQCLSEPRCCKCTVMYCIGVFHWCLAWLVNTLRSCLWLLQYYC